MITGLELGGAEALLLELCREDRRRGRTAVVASLLSEGPMRRRFAEIGVEVVGLGMRRGAAAASGPIRLARLIRRRRPRIVQGWLYHANLAALAANWLAALWPRPKLAWSILGAVPDFALYPRRLRRAVGLGARLSPLVDGILYNSRVALDEHARLGFRARLSRFFPNGSISPGFTRSPACAGRCERSRAAPGGGSGDRGRPQRPDEELARHAGRSGGGRA